jgi:hypothetical protein
MRSGWARFMLQNQRINPNKRYWRAEIDPRWLYELFLHKSGSIHNDTLLERFQKEMNMLVEEGEDWVSIIFPSLILLCALALLLMTLFLNEAD